MWCTRKYEIIKKKIQLTLSTKSKRGGWGVGKVFSVQMTLTKKIKIDM